MSDNDASTYGDRSANAYDTRISRSDDETERMVAGLAALADRGPAREGGIGTGRVTLPLAVRGAAVSDSDTAAALVMRLRAQPGGDEIPVTRGSVADAWPAGHVHHRGGRQTSRTTGLGAPSSPGPHTIPTQQQDGSP